MITRGGRYNSALVNKEVLQPDYVNASMLLPFQRYAPQDLKRG